MGYLQRNYAKNNKFSPHYKTNKCTNGKLYFFTQNCRNSGTFRSVLIVFRELLNINETYIKT